MLTSVGVSILGMLLKLAVQTMLDRLDKSEADKNLRELGWSDVITKQQQTTAEAAKRATDAQDEVLADSRDLGSAIGKL